MREVLWHPTLLMDGFIAGVEDGSHAGLPVTTVPAGKLARLLSMEISTLSRNARLLQQDGLILIEHAERGNGRILSLTDASAEKLAKLRPAWRAAQRQAHELLGIEASEAIKQLVDPTSADQGTG